MEKKIVINVNTNKHPVEAAPSTPLLYVLRNELNLRGPRFGCGLGQCGACTVHVDGKAVKSCQVEVSEVENKAVTTLEGLSSGHALSTIQQAFVDEQAAQCGYCINGMIMAAAAFLKSNPKPTQKQIRDVLSPTNICRCGTHMRIVRAIHRAAHTPSKEG